MGNTRRYRIGGLYGFGQPPSSIRFGKVLAEGPSLMYLRAFAHPPELGWDDPGRAFPSLTIESQLAGEAPFGPDILVVEVAIDGFASWVPHFWAAGSVGGQEVKALNDAVLTRVPAIPAQLRSQLLRIEPSQDRELEYRPCTVHLNDGSVHDRVYVVEAEPYIRKWGIWPDHDVHKRHVSIADVTRIEESPSRLPASVASKVYEAGESGMGYSVFTLVLCDGRQLPTSAGNAIDFVELPEGVTHDMIVDVIPHQARSTSEPARGAAQSASFSWCLYRVKNDE
jgi:hypothetical protein